MIDLSQRRSFLLVGFLFEGGLAVVALVLDWFLRTGAIEQVRLEVAGAAWGIAATVPLFALFVVLFRRRSGPLEEIKRILVELLGPSLSACRWYELAALAAVTGFSEELLFRGVLQPWMSRWNPVVGIVGSNVLFGLAHCLTPMYGLFAGMLGVFLGMLLQWPAEGNLLAPILTHALYDFLAFLVVAGRYRRESCDTFPRVADDASPKRKRGTFLV